MKAFRDILSRGVTFDIETTGIGPGHQMYSYAYTPWNKEMEERFLFRHTDTPFEGKVKYPSAFSLEQWSKLDPNYVNSRQIDFLGALKELNAVFEKKNIIVGHNLTFDFNFLIKQAMESGEEDVLKEVAKMQSRINRYGINLFTTPEELAAASGKSIKDAEMYLSRDFGAGQTIKNRILLPLSYTSYRDNRNPIAFFQRLSDEIMKSGRGQAETAIVDTLNVSRAFIDLLKSTSSVKHGETKLYFKSDSVIGLKLEHMAEAIGIDVSKIAHTGSDTVFNQDILETMLENVDTLIKATQEGHIDITNLTPRGRALVHYFSMLSDPIKTGGGYWEKGVRDINDFVHDFEDFNALVGKGFVDDFILRSKRFVSDSNLVSSIYNAFSKGAVASETLEHVDFIFRDIMPIHKVAEISRGERAIQQIVDVYGGKFTKEEIKGAFLSTMLDVLEIYKSAKESGGDVDAIKSVITEEIDKRLSKLSELNSNVFSRLAHKSRSLAQIEEGISASEGSLFKVVEKFGITGKGMRKAAIGAAVVVAGANIIGSLSNRSSYNEDIDSAIPVHVDNSGQFLGFIPESRKQMVTPVAGIGLEMSKHAINHYLM